MLAVGGLDEAARAGAISVYKTAQSKKSLSQSNRHLPGYRGRYHDHVPMTKTHKRLRRLDRVWIEFPVYFVTTCLENRKLLLDNDETADILISEWQISGSRYGWTVGSYVIMPDHVHFFCSHHWEAKTLSTFVGKWKEWTSKNVRRSSPRRSINWQRGFFDHVIRSGESYSEKWDYVYNNPVRAGLVENPKDWPYWGVLNDLSV